MPYLLWPLLSLGVFLPLTKLLQKRHPRLSAVFKMLATLCAAALACSGGLPGNSWLCLAALLLCAAADGLLCVHFVAGMAVFAAGHVAYMGWFLSRQGLTWPSAALFPPLLALGAVLLWRWRNHLGRLKLPMAAYAVILSAMGALGIPCGGLTALAACLFILSDMMVCRQVVMPVSTVFDVSALAIYYAAQLLFGAACAQL